MGSEVSRAGKKDVTSIDCYAEAHEVIHMVDAEGLTAEADSLRDVLAAGSTATEILMGLRWQLQQIDTADKVANRTTKRKIRELIGKLDRVLS